MDNLRLVPDPSHTADAIERRHRRFGLQLFLAYLLVYAGFIALAAFYHTTLASQALFGVNLAVVYGFGLIGFAFLLALIFLWAGSAQNSPTSTVQKRG